MTKGDSDHTYQQWLLFVMSHLSTIREDLARVAHCQVYLQHPPGNGRCMSLPNKVRLDTTKLEHQRLPFKVALKASKEVTHVDERWIL